jgi:hypothetical protein
MKIQVFSRSEVRAALIERAIGFYSKYLGINNTDCTIFVAPRKSMRTKEKRIGCINRFIGKDYLIRIDNQLSLHRLLTVLAHEMVHAKQMIRGEIKQEKYRNGRAKFIWHGEEVRLPYHKQPWELEAYTMEIEMVTALMKHVHKNRRKAK